MLQYLKTARPGTRMAIFGLTSRLTMLQAFTSDPETLKKVLDTKKASTSPLLPDTTEPASTDLPAAIQAADPGLSASIAYNVATFEAEMQATQLQMRIRYTLDALNQLARYLAAIPGRKNLIWFSGSFPINVLPDTDSGGDPFAGQLEMEDEFRETINLLGRAQVAVYPIDARGLMVSPTMSAANSGAQYTKPGAFGKAERKFSTQTSAEHGTMLEMAQNTGGKAFFDTNGLAQAVQSAVDAGANYYTLTYVPTDPNWHGAYRNINVQLAKTSSHPGSTLAYRHGYFADDPDSPKTAKSNPATANTPTPLRVAMLHGAPAATQILFKVAVMPASKDPDPAALPGNSPAPQAKAPWLRYMVQFAADSRNLTQTTTPEGKIHLSMDFVALVYDADGNRINGNTVSATVTEAQFADLRRTGVQYRQQISVPAKGIYSIRVLINDLQGSHLGAVEVPLAAVQSLPPVNLPPPAPPQ